MKTFLIALNRTGWSRVRVRVCMRVNSGNKCKCQSCAIQRATPKERTASTSSADGSKVSTLYYTTPHSCVLIDSEIIVKDFALNSRFEDVSNCCKWATLKFNGYGTRMTEEKRLNELPDYKSLPFLEHRIQ